MQPRLIRLRDAPTYLGMDKNRFNNEVRPYLTTIKIGRQGIAFDRCDLDQWAENYKQQSGSPAKRRMKWVANDPRDSLNVETFGTSTKKSMDEEFQKVLAQVLSKKQNVI